MRLVPDEEYAQLKKQRTVRDYDPRLAGAVIADDARRLALSDQAGDENMRERLMKHGHALDRIRDMRAQYSSHDIASLRDPTLPEVRSRAMDQIPATRDLPDEPPPIGDIVGLVPSTRQPIARRVISQIDHHPDIIRITNSGEVEIDGRILPHTHIADFMRALFTQSKSAAAHPPPGIREFVDALRRIHTPPAYLAQFDKSQEQQQTGKGFQRLNIVRSKFGTPPGLRSHKSIHPRKILRVYRDV